MKCLTEILEALRSCNKEISDVKEYSLNVMVFNKYTFIEGSFGKDLLLEKILNSESTMDQKYRIAGWISFKDNSSWLRKFYKCREDEEVWEYLMYPTLKNDSLSNLED